MLNTYNKRFLLGSFFYLLIGLFIFLLNQYIDSHETLSPIYEVRTIIFIFYILMYFVVLYIIYFFNRSEQTLIKNKQRLEKSQLRLRLAFENIPNGNIVIDWHGIIIEFSKSAEAILGYTVNDVIGKNVEVLIPDMPKGTHDKYIKNYLNTGVEKVIGSGGRHTHALHKDGHLTPIYLCIGTMVIDYEMLFIASITDQTQQTKLNKQLFEAQKMQSIGQLACGLSHDFNNLLGIAIGNLQLLERKSKLDESSSKKIVSALQALNRGASLTTQLLNYSRADNSLKAKINLNNDILGIKDLIEQTATKNINIIYSLADDLHDTDIKRGEFGDALINLTANARDAMPNGGNLFIETSNCKQEEFEKSVTDPSSYSDYILLSIRDTGHGIEKDKIAHIFEPFFTTKERSKGTGLGLAMVSNFIEDAQGTIKIYSEVNVGTTFHLYFPKSDSSAQSETVENKQASDDGGTEKLLVVDDEPELLVIAKHNLEDAGYEVLTADSASTAITLLNQHPDIALLLTDIVMPNGLNGFDLALEAATTNPDLKIALMSGYTPRAGQKQVEDDLLAKYLARHLLQKPYSRDDLLHFIREHLDVEYLTKWKQEYITGIDIIDHDHRAIFEVVNRINTAICHETSPNLSPLLIELDRFISRHHKREEIVMEVAEFPQCVEHRDTHRQISKKLADYATGLKIVSSKEDKEQLLMFLKDLLKSHIEEEILQFANFSVTYKAAITKALAKSCA